MISENNPPVGGQGAASEPGARFRLHDTPGLAELDALAEQVDGAFVLVVHVTGGQYRRRCYLTAASAQRAADRALARGENVRIYLAELKPLHRLIGGG